MEAKITLTELASLASALTVADFALRPYSESASSYEKQRLESALDQIGEASNLVVKAAQRVTVTAPSLAELGEQISRIDIHAQRCELTDSPSPHLRELGAAINNLALAVRVRLESENAN